MTLNVTIIIPVLNGQSTIRKCLDSLMRLEYPSSSLEIIIVDNGSTDSTPDILGSYPVKLLYEREKRGPSAARNLGISHANGEVLAFTDADCIVSKEWLKFGTLQFSHHEVGCVAGGVEGCFPNSAIERFLIRRKYMSQRLTLSHPFLPYPQTANAFYRKEVFRKIGGFRPDLISGEDADLAWRMQIETAYKLIYVEEAKVYHAHRSTIKGFIKQRLNWGYGAGVLYNIYREKMKAQNCHPIKERIRRIGVSPVLSDNEKIKLSDRNTEDREKIDYLFHALSAMAWVAGFFYGAACGRVKKNLIR